MTISLYMDHHVPSAIASGLRQRAVDVLTAAEDGTAALDDEQLLDRAMLLERALFSEDRDLLAIAHQRQRMGREFAGLVYAHQLSISIGQAVRDLELVAKVLDPNDIRNRVEYLPLS
jgi:Domain of unknown function (DUF5615)